ncbi:MAG: 4Fe-4S ferredoxin, partial [Bacteroidota bacterium]
MSMDECYIDLAAALDMLPNGFPRTASGVELKILKKIFSPEEAFLASRLRGTAESVAAIAARAGLPVDEARARLKGLAKRGLIWGGPEEKELRFRLAPFIVGIYEAKAVPMDHEYAHLIEDYMAEGGAAGIMQPEPALHRVIPAQSAVKSEWILPYDDVRAILAAAKTFHV